MSGKLEGIARSKKMTSLKFQNSFQGSSYEGNNLKQDLVMKVAQGNESGDVVGMRLDDVVKRLRT
jgi:hypothetical protein